jgi:hypothetical protein
MITSLVMTVTSHLDMSHLLPQAHASGTLEHFPLTPSCERRWQPVCRRLYGLLDRQVEGHGECGVPLDHKDLLLTRQSSEARQKHDGVKGKCSRAVDPAGHRVADTLAATSVPRRALANGRGRLGRLVRELVGHVGHGRVDQPKHPLGAVRVSVSLPSPLSLSRQCATVD